MEKKKEQMHVLDLDLITEIMWATSELVNIEKHLYTALGDIETKLKQNPDDKNLKLVRDATHEMLNKTRIYRSKHLEKITDFLKVLKIKGLWCCAKHEIGGMHQFGEVGAKAVFLGDKEYANLCFETSQFCLELFMFTRKLAEKIEKGEAECSEKTSDQTAGELKSTE